MQTEWLYQQQHHATELSSTYLSTRMSHFTRLDVTNSVCGAVSMMVRSERRCVAAVHVMVAVQPRSSRMFARIEHRQFGCDSCKLDALMLRVEHKADMRVDKWPKLDDWAGVIGTFVLEHFPSERIAFVLHRTLVYYHMCSSRSQCFKPNSESPPRPNVRAKVAAKPVSQASTAHQRPECSIISEPACSIHAPMSAGTFAHFAHLLCRKAAVAYYARQMLHYHRCSLAFSISFARTNEVTGSRL